MTAASQDPSSNPFEVLGVPAGFEMDEAQLHRQFVLRAAAAHPDRFTDPFEQAQAAQRAATINDAYQVLRDPQARAEALIELLGGLNATERNTLHGLLGRLRVTMPTETP